MMNERMTDGLCSSSFIIHHSPFPPMVTLQDSLLSSSARKSPIRMRPDLVAQRQHYLGRTLLGGEGSGRAGLLPISGRGIRHSADVRRRDQPRRGQGPIRGRVSAAEDHARGVAAVLGHVAPQRIGDRRRARPGPPAPQTPRRTQAEDAAGRRKQRPLHPLQGVRSRASADLALSETPLVLLAAGRVFVLHVGPVGGDAGGGRVRRVSLEAPRVPPVLQRPQRLPVGDRAGDHQGVSRVRARAELQALRRRMSRNGHHGARADALPLLQRLRLLDAAEQVGAGGHRRGGHLRRSA